MANDNITNKMLLEHMQAMKNELIQKFYGLENRFSGLENKVSHLEQKMDQGFEEARQHREAMQEDLDATIRMQAKHDKKLARI